MLWLRNYCLIFIFVYNWIYFRDNKFDFLIWKMKTVAIPILEGCSTVVVYPHNSQERKVNMNWYRIISYWLYFQGLSFVTVFFNGDELPKATGKFIFFEFKESYDYCLLPSYSKEGRLMSYSSRPAFVNLFRYSYEISKVYILILHINLI